MRFKRWTGILAALALCGTMAYAHPLVTPQGKQEPVEFISPQELKAKIAKNETLAIIDLRAQTAYEQSDTMVKGSIHTKVRKAAYRLREVPREREVIIYCACPSDEAAIIATRMLLAEGFKRVRVLKGGWKAWQEADGQMQPRR